MGRLGIGHLPEHPYSACVKAVYGQMAVRQKTAQLNFFVSPELKAAAIRAAKADQRSLTSLVEKLLTDYCRATGFMPENGQLGATVEAPTKPMARRKGKG